jgi:electron transport complex protein RnfC
MLMRERPEEIIAGIHVIMHMIGAERCLVGIEDNKPEAFVAVRVAARASAAIQVVKVPTRYPTGGEKQLIQVLTGREVPSQGLPVDIGTLCVNVGTAAAVHRAINLGEPLISRYVTVSGPGVRGPRNLEARIGTPVGELIEQCGGLDMEDYRLIMGGPMMGFEMPSNDVPMIKATNCVLVTAHEPQPHPQPCIRCGRCTEVCPAQLLPQQLYWHARARSFDKLKDYDLFDCIECGCCAYVCPSRLPLVHYYRYAKTEILERERDKRQADVARRRTEFRRFRLEREKQEREARHAAKKAALKSGTPSADAALAAAQQRVQENSSAKVARLKQALTRTDDQRAAPPTLSGEERAIIKAAREREAGRDPGNHNDETTDR